MTFALPRLPARVARQRLVPVEPYTPCTLTRASGPEIPVGAFLIAATIAYRVDRVRGRTLHVTRWPLDAVPSDADVYVWTWGRRDRRT